MSVLQIAAVGMEDETFELVESLVRAVAEYAGQFTVAPFPRLLHDYDRRSAMILLDASTVGTSSDAARQDQVGRRSRVVIDLRTCTADQVWRAGEQSVAPLLVIGNPAANRKATEDLKRLLFTNPLEEALAPVLRDTFSDAQVEFLREILWCADRNTPSAIARELFVSLRTLRRRCRDLGLQTPQRIHSVARVLLGVQWIKRTDQGIAAAAMVGGYSEPAAFRRAVRRSFGVPPRQLLEDWNNGQELEKHLEQAILAE